MAKKQTPLQQALEGKTDALSERQAKSALLDLTSKFSNLDKRAKKAAANAAEAGGHLIHAAETQGSLFLSSMASGFFGPDKLKVGGKVDVRLAAGLAAEVYGLYDCLQGGGKAANHALAIGDGVLGSYLGEVAFEAGQTLAQSRKGAAPAAAPAPASTTLQGAANLIPAPNMAGREILLTPAVEGDDDELGVRPRRKRVHARRATTLNRFRAAEQEEEEAAEAM